MAISVIKSTVRSRIKSLEYCDDLSTLLNATTETELLTAGFPWIVWAYQSGVVDDALIGSDFTEATLNSMGIYTTGSFTLSNPPDEIFILKDAVVTLTINSTNKCKVNVMGMAEATITVSADSFADIKVYDDAEVDLTIQGNSIVKLQTKEKSVVTVTAEGNTLTEMALLGYSQVTVTNNDSAYTNAQTFGHSQLTYTLNDSSDIFVRQNNNSTVTNTAP